MAIQTAEIISGGGAATKEFYVPFTYGYGASSSRTGQYAAYYVDAADDRAYAAFDIPHDFSSIIEAVIIVKPLVNQAAANWDIASNYAANGEDDETHAESDAGTTYNITNSIFFEVDISGILTALVAGDRVGIRITNVDGSAHRFYALGISFKYS